MPTLKNLLFWSALGVCGLLYHVAVVSKVSAASFSNHLTVDTIQLTELDTSTIVVVTVRIPTKLSSVKCAAIAGSRYLGVGSMVNASPPAENVYVTIPGTGHGSSVRAECSSE